MAELGILNVGTGDTKLVFDINNPEDCARAARTVADMIRRGYVILVEAGKDPKSGEILYRRAKEFRQDTCEYIIAGDADVHAGATAEENNEQSSGATARAKANTKGSKTERKGGRARQPSLRTVHASTVRAIAVPRSAGG